MRDFVHYPDQAAEVRQLVDNRRHFVNLVYAMAIVGTFQISMSAGWYAYTSEGYVHLISGYQNFLIGFEMVGGLFAMALIYLNLYVRKNALMGFMILFFAAQIGLKMFQFFISETETVGRRKFKMMLQLSEFDTLFLLYDCAFCFAAVVNLTMAICATLHFSPMVYVKMSFDDHGERKVGKCLRAAAKQRISTFNVTSSSNQSASQSSVAQQSESCTQRMMTVKKDVKAKIDENADVKITKSRKLVKAEQTV